MPYVPEMHLLARLLLAAALGLPLGGEAQEVAPPPSPGEAEGEPVELDPMVIQTGKAEAPGVETTRLDRAALEPLDASSAAELLEVVPGAQTRTNSRGETLVYLRNSGERQLAVFLDGALLNVPWDNRVDLSLVPAAVIDRVAVVAGPAPMEYGANVPGGVVEFASGWAHGPGRTVAEVQAGTEERFQLSAGHGGAAGGLRWSLGATHAQAGGLALPGDAGLAFSQPDSSLRTNTDSRTTGVAGTLSLDAGDGTVVGLTVAHLDSERGIAPEGHKDPSVSRVRFWRYPFVRSTLAVLSAEGALGAATRWRGAAWANRAEQAIDAYADATYADRSSREDTDDLTFGGRLLGRRALGSGGLTLALNALGSTHWQQDLSYADGADPSPPRLLYRQATLSGGAAVDARPFERTAVTLGASYEAMVPLRTGDKPDLDPFTGWGVTLGATHDLDEHLRLRAAAGRKVRFPTLRELFGEALGQFLLNPDLRPETSLVVEAGVELHAGRVRAGLTGFSTFTKDTIDQRSVRLDGETRPRRQRVNLEGSRTYGAELTARALLPRHLEVDGSLTVTRVRRVADQPGDETRLAEKPEALGRLGLGWAPPSGPSARVGASYTGRAYSLADDGSLVALPTSLALDARLGWRFAWTGARAVELFVRGDNLTDANVVPQLGLPAAGRTVQGGANLVF